MNARARGVSLEPTVRKVRLGLPPRGGLQENLNYSGCITNISSSLMKSQLSLIDISERLQK